MNQSQIQAQAKKILDNFAKALDKVKIPKEKPLKKPMQGMREEGQGKPANENFRKQFFKNAPNKDQDYIIAEKKKW